MLEVLTPRQRQVCDLLMRGKTSKEISRVLGISPKTIEVHKTEIYRTLNVRNVIEMVLKILGEPV